MASDKVTKYDLVEAVYKNTNCEKRIVQEVVENFILEVKKSLESGSTIELRGFGTFEPRKRAARSGRNPQTGATIKIAAKTIPAFSAGKKFKEAVK